MSLYYGLPILLIGAVLQSVWLERISIFGSRPDLVLVLAVTWTVIRGADEGALWGFIGGVFCDLLSGGPFGLWTVSLTVVTFLVGQPWIYALGPTLSRLAITSAAGTVLAHVLLLVLMIILGYSINIPRAFLTIVVPASLLNLLLSPFVFRFLVFFHERSQQQRRRSL
jgi:rod shape-determining protein MreD